MFTSFSVQNFRCFSDLKLPELGRFNLITGKNNVGKTALLEAMHLHCLPDKPELWVKVHQVRGVDEPLGFVADVARWLFFESHSSDPIGTRSEDTTGATRTTEMRLLDPPVSRKLFPEVERSLVAHLPDAAGSDSPRLLLRYEVDGGIYDSAIVALSNVRGSLTAAVPKKVANSFLGSLSSSSKRDVQNFGQLEGAKRIDEILPALHIIEPRLKRLSLIPFAGRPVIHADLEGLDRLVPISLVGEGMRRLLSMVLAIATVPNGVIFIDELENGLHYSVLPDVWSVIAAAARRSDVQVFATTHSWECLRAAHTSFSQAESYDFKMHRLDRVDGKIEVTTYGEETIETSLMMGLEVR